MAHAPSIGTQLVIRLETPNAPGSFGVLASAIDDAGGIVGAVDTRAVGKATITRDVTVNVPSEVVGDRVREALERIDGVRIVNVSDSTFLAHLGGKIRTAITRPVKTRQDLSTVYTPGVARVSIAIAKDPSKAYALTIKRNTVCVVTDGTAVLGLGDIGPFGAAPVMEGKCMLFKQFADIDAFPICLDTKDVDEIVADGEAHRADLRRHQPRGHQRAALLRGRAPAGRGARHPGDARRSARHRGRDPGGADERRRRRRQEASTS